MKQPKAGDLRVKRFKTSPFYAVQQYAELKILSIRKYGWLWLGEFRAKSDALLFIKAKKRIGEGK